MRRQPSPFFPPSAFASAASGVLFLVFVGAFSAVSAEGPGESFSIPGQSATNDAIRQLAPGKYEIGKVRLDQGKRTLTFPAAVNLREGPIEYVLVTDYGKIHESLLRTEVSPYSIQVALLLLGAAPSKTNATPAGKSSTPITRTPLGIDVSWMDGKRRRQERVGSFVWDRANHSKVGRGKWFFAGSSFRKEGFAAQLDGSIITVIDDDDAIIGSGLQKRDDDDNWLARGTRLPPLDTPVEVVVTVPR